MSKTQSRLPVLDGLRFFAALLVMMAHYSAWVVGDQGVSNSFTQLLATFAGFGMPLFFVLSGFVIHYNYHQVHRKGGGVKEYLIARFTRLYPLFILLFAIEFIICFRIGRGSCVQAGDRLGLLLALPYYLSLTQDWVFGVIGKNNLIYQYFMVSAVSWSISLEVFFYISYLVLAFWLVRQKSIARQLVVFVLAQVIVIGYLRFCSHYSSAIDSLAKAGFGTCATVEYGYQDSLLRWLLYFSPLVNLPAFFFGTIVANIYMAIQNKAFAKFEQTWGIWLTFSSITAVCALHYWFYILLAPTNGFIGRSASVLYAPFIAVMIFCLTRYSSTMISKFFSLPFFVKLGEASFSIYLLHAFFGWYPRDFYYLHLNPWLLYVLAICCILIISRISYVLFERPVQSFLRKKMLGKKSNTQTIRADVLGATAE